MRVNINPANQLARRSCPVHRVVMQDSGNLAGQHVPEARAIIVDGDNSAGDCRRECPALGRTTHTAMATLALPRRCAEGGDRSRARPARRRACVAYPCGNVKAIARNARGFRAPGPGRR